MIHATKAIVLRTVKYGESSVILTALTEAFGIQSYLVNGVRKSGTSGKMQLLQPGSLLDMEVYYRHSGSLQRVRSMQWSRLYDHLFSDILKNGMVVFMVEMVQKTITEPETNSDLFAFFEEALSWLDRADSSAIATFPLYFAVHWSHFFGFRIPIPSASVQEHANLYLDLQEGAFTNQSPSHALILEGKEAYYMAELLKIQHPDELQQVEIEGVHRSRLLDALLIYYRIHLSAFGEIRSLQVLRAILK